MSHKLSAYMKVLQRISPEINHIEIIEDLYCSNKNIISNNNNNNLTIFITNFLSI